jgi:hypothetical protein
MMICSSTIILLYNDLLFNKICTFCGNPWIYPRVKGTLPALTRTRYAGTGNLRVRVRVRVSLPAGNPCWTLTQAHPKYPAAAAALLALRLFLSTATFSHLVVVTSSSSFLCIYHAGPRSHYTRGASLRSGFLQKNNPSCRVVRVIRRYNSSIET